MSGDFDFLTPDAPGPARRDRDDRPARSRRPSRDDEPDDRDDRRPAPKGKPAGKRGPGLLIAASVGGLLLVIGGTVTLILVARAGSKPPDPPPDKPPTQPAGPGPVAKKDVADPNSPSRETVDRVKKATLRVVVQLKDGKGVSGSGFVEKSSGLVVTNAHVVGMTDKEPGPDAIFLVVNSGEGPKEYTLGGELVDVDPETDLALIRPYIIEVGERHVVPEGLVVPKNPAVTELQKLFVFGFPLGTQLGAEISVRPTTVTSFRKDPKTGKEWAIQVEGGITSGNSGGPVVDVKGNVVGVAAAVVRNTEINLAVRGEVVHAFLAKKRK